MRKLLLTLTLFATTMGLFADDPFNPTVPEDFGYLSGTYMVMPPTKSIYNTATISGDKIVLYNSTTKQISTFMWMVLRKENSLYCAIGASIYLLAVEGSKLTLTPQFGEDSSNQIIYLWRKK